MRSAAVVFLGLISCATAPKAAKHGEIRVDVDATTFVGSIDFITDDGSDVAQLTAIEPGLTHHVLKVKPGNWCLRQIGTRGSGIGVTFVRRRKRCVEVTVGESTEWGRVAVDPRNLRTADGGFKPRSW